MRNSPGRFDPVPFTRVHDDGGWHHAWARADVPLEYHLVVDGLYWKEILRAKEWWRWGKWLGGGNLKQGRG